MARRRAQQAVQRRRQKQAKQILIIGSIVVAIGLIVVFLYLVVLAPEAELPDGVETAYVGLPQSLTAEGYGVLGPPEGTDVIEVREYSSFACPHCKDLQPTIKQLIPYIEQDLVRLVFVPIYNIAGEGAEEGARAAICAGEQGKFYEMHDTMFYWQGRFGYGSRRIESAAKKLDLDVGRFKECYDSGETATRLRQARAEFDRLGFTGTPSMTLNGQIIDAGSVISQVEQHLDASQ